MIDLFNHMTMAYRGLQFERLLEENLGIIRYIDEELIYVPDVDEIVNITEPSIMIDPTANNLILWIV